RSLRLGGARRERAEAHRDGAGDHAVHGARDQRRAAHDHDGRGPRARLPPHASAERAHHGKPHRVRSRLTASLVAIAFGVGALIGAVGVGGILLVAALAMVGHLDIHEAAATALFSFIFTGVT